MRIDAFLHQSPMFAITRAARRFEALAVRALAGADLSFVEGLTLAALFFEAPKLVKPSELAETFGTTRGAVSHCVSSLEAKGLLERRIDPDDARAYQLMLKPNGKKCALSVIGVFDKLQHELEGEIGKAALGEMLKAIRRLEARAALKPSHRNNAYTRSGAALT
jgi:DNA-binding MarR family transcriptional regulator